MFDTATHSSDLDALGTTWANDISADAPKQMRQARNEYRRQCAMAMWIGSVPEWPAFYDAYIHGQI